MQAARGQLAQDALLPQGLLTLSHNLPSCMCSHHNAICAPAANGRDHSRASAGAALRKPAAATLVFSSLLETRWVSRFTSRSGLVITPQPARCAFRTGQRRQYRCEGVAPAVHVHLAARRTGVHQGKRSTPRRKETPARLLTCSPILQRCPARALPARSYVHKTARASLRVYEVL